MLAVQTAQNMASKKPRLLVVIDSDLKEDFEALCEIENRSMSNQAVTLIKNFVDIAKREGKLSDRTNSKGAK
jgi:L-amino acid N-acyltransferase YncA